MMKNRLATKIFKYLAIFSLFILIFLFFFQVIFINTFYEWTKTKTIKNLSKDILVTENDTSLYDKLDRVSYEENVCIELSNSNGDNLYSSSGNNCRLRSKMIKRKFILSNKETNTYNLVNSMLIIPSLLDNGVYVTNQYLSESYKIVFELTEGQVSNNSFTNRYDVSIVDSRGNIVNEVTSFEVGIKVPTNAQIPTDLNSVGDYFTVNQISFTGVASPVEFTYENGFLKVNTTTGIIEVTYQYNANSEPTNPENPTPNEGIPAWAWALIGVGIVVVIGGAAGLTYYLIRKKNK